MKIYQVKGGTLTEGDRLELARLLVKAGYRVSIGRERPSGKPSGPYIYFVEYEE